MSEAKTAELPCDLSKLRHQMERHLEAMLVTLKEGDQSIRKSAARLQRTNDRITRLLKERFGDEYEEVKDRIYICRGGRIEYRPENGPVEVLQ